MRRLLQTCDVVVIGAGPAGLTAASELLKGGLSPVVLEAENVVGGISQTVVREGWRFDIGGHRFFTKVARVRDFWTSTLPPEDFLTRPRMSRILYRGRLYDYPLRATNALKNLGLVEALKCVGSYLWVRISPPQDQSTFEGWVAARFGWRLYRTFFKTYTEKVWGVPADQIQADWAAQRIKNLSLGKAVKHALFSRGKASTEVTSLIEEFQYPKYGPGMMWEACATQIQEAGASLVMNAKITSISRSASGIVTRATGGIAIESKHVISSMPLNELISILEPQAPSTVLLEAAKLKHRDFLTVALVVPAEFSFPDNWIYIHDPRVTVGRIQNYGSWSPYMIKAGHTCLGMEYFVNRGDALWEMDDSQLIALATQEIEDLGLITSGSCTCGYVVRVPKTYPVYDSDYSPALSAIRTYLESAWPEVITVGRNGMHRYNNQDHSMLTAMYAVDNIVHGTDHDIWNVNVESEYHETANSGTFGTGRSAPTVG